MASLEFELVPDQGIDAESVAELRGALLADGAVAVENVRVGRPPSDRRPGAIIQTAGIAVKFVGTLAQAIGSVREWLGKRRNAEPASITLVIGDDSVTITNPSTGTEQRLVDLFIERHGGGGVTGQG